MQARAKQGALLREGLAVVLVGRPNVGKSSLLNRLAGDAVAIVTPIAGTTRDAVPAAIEIHGVPLTIVDTAGLRATDDPIETLGIERTWAAVARADLALVMVDAATGGTLAEADAAILAQLPPALPRLVVHNKIDLVGLPAAVNPRVTAGGEGVAGRTEREVFVSAKTGAGIDLLQREMLAQAGAHEDMEDAFLARERHLVALREAGVHLASAAEHVAEAKPPLELVGGGPAPRAHGAVDDHRRVHLRRSAGGNLLALLHRQVSTRRIARADAARMRQAGRKGPLP